MPTDPILQELPAAVEISEHCYGGMPVQLGWCNGHNTKLNCLEYHRDSEFNLGTEDFILLLARQDEMIDGMLNTAKVKAFKVPAGVLVEVYATTLHYAPCHVDSDKGFRVLVALPWLTNTDKPVFEPKTVEDAYMTARNKWLLAHPESNEAISGAKVGLVGKNIDTTGNAKLMRVFHLDAGRKFFSAEVIKSMIDTLSESGFTHFQLYFSDNQGFRFALPDLTVTTKFDTYDLRPALGDGYVEFKTCPSGCGKYLTPKDMEEIITYARSKHMDIIPVMNMPGHMGTILEKFPQLRYPGSRSSINLRDEVAVSFALAILKKYVDYFADHGCRYFSIGADEFANDLSKDENVLIMGLDKIYHDGDMKLFVQFVNRAIDIVAARNMTPLAFNDGICYHNDNKTYGAIDNRIVVCYWTCGWNGYTPASVKFLEEHGYGLINADHRLYCGVGCQIWDEKTEMMKTFDPHICNGDNIAENPVGAMLCCWCNRGNYDGQDDGKTVAPKFIPVMKAFGETMDRWDNQ